MAQDLVLPLFRLSFKGVFFSKHHAILQREEKEEDNNREAKCRHAEWSSRKEGFKVATQDKTQSGPPRCVGGVAFACNGELVELVAGL